MTADAPHSGSARPTFAAIRASVLVPIVRELDGRWGRADVLLAHHGVLRSQLADPYALVPLSSYLAVFETAADVLKEPTLGARLGAEFMPADIGPVGILFSTAPTIRAAFERISNSINALQGGTASALLVSPEADEAVWTYSIVDPKLRPRRQDSEFSLSATCQLVRASFSAGWNPLEVHFEHGPPPDPSPLQRVFRAPIRFGQTANRLVIDKSLIDRPYRTEDKGLAQVLERHVLELSKEQDGEDAVEDQVRVLIGIHLGHQPITLRAIARQLGLSPRTLQRRLADEGTSLRDLVRDHRRDIARIGLAEQGARCAEVAAALGYADGTVFWRAYKSWTGSSPTGRRRAP